MAERHIKQNAGENHTGGRPKSSEVRDRSDRSYSWSVGFLSISVAVGLLSAFAISRYSNPDSGQTPLTGCQIACSHLASKFAENVHFAGNDSSFIVWDAKQQEVQSACRVEPTTSEQVSEIMQVLVGNWCRFAIKSGGHARNADDSVSSGGVTVDMVRMKAVEVSEDRASARLGSGHVLYTLYSGLEAHGLSTTGGRVADVGLGGFALGGGISNFSPQYGLAVDNVLEYEVVLANASIVRVNEHSHPDLYFALRGGMNNFGIVTHFTMRTFPQGQIYSGTLTFNPDKRDDIIQQAYSLTTEWKNDTRMAFYYGYAYNQASDQFRLSFTPAYSSPVTDPLPFRALDQIPHESSTVRIEYMSNFSLEGAAGRPPGARNQYATISYQPSADLDRQLQDILAEEIQPIKEIRGFSPNMIMQPLYEAAIRAGHYRGGNALGIESEGPLTMVLLTMGWSDARDDEAAYAFASRFVRRAKAATEAAGKANRWLYINYAHQRQDPFGGYGEANRQRLIRIQKAVDPRGVFSSKGLCRGYFKLY